MTREEAIDIIKCLAWHTRPDEEDIEQAIEVLNQEPILDKIIAEIENDWQLKKYPSSPFSCGLRRAIEIFDKYKAESEPQESNIEKRKPCINYEDGCEEWAGCPCVYYKGRK